MVPFYTFWVGIKTDTFHKIGHSIITQCRENMCKANDLNSSEAHWMELALDDPMFQVEYFRAAGTHLYSFDLIQRKTAKEGPRNIDFELVYATYLATNEIIEAIKPAKTSRIKILASSQEHWDVVYVEEFPVDQWSYTQVDKMLDGLAEQLTMKQNLNYGLLVRFIFFP